MADIFPSGSRPEGIYFRPKVIRNEATGQFVLWVNHLAPAATPLQSYPDARLMVATSPSPNGTFQMVNEQANVEVRVGQKCWVHITSCFVPSTQPSGLLSRQPGGGDVFK